MLFYVLLLTPILVGLIAVVPPAVRLYGLLGPRRFWLHVASAAFIVVGSLPPAALWVLIYARSADYMWAIRGPYPFSHLGSGPFWLWSLGFVTLFSAVSWGIAVWLKVVAHRGD